MTVKRICAAAAVALAAVQAAAIDDAHLDWWRHDRFGLFVHFGLYSMPARHEWVKTREQIPEEKYDEYFKRFDPDLFDAKDWAKRAKAAGMKYAVLTSKHHEGFCLFDSAATDYKSTKTPFGRDIVKEFVEAFRAEGLKVGFYYSLLDWHHPHYAIDKHHPLRPAKCRPGDKKKLGAVPEDEWAELNKSRDMDVYRKYMFDQVTELLTKYGKIDIMWFDFTSPGNHGKTPEDWNAKELLALVRRLQPGIIVNNRLGLNGKDEDFGDFVTPEQCRITKWAERNGARAPWELCQTFSGSWGYHREERSWKTPHQIIDILVSCVSHGGNLILNVGPTGRGDFDYRANDALAAIGAWMKHNSRSIYGCTEPPEEFKAPAGTRLTWNPVTKRLYAHLFDYKGGKLPVGFADRIAYAQFLHDASELAHGADGIALPETKPPVEVPVVEMWMR